MPSDLDSLVRFLKTSTGFVLFVGSGINYGYVPLWKQLCSNLLDVSLPLLISPNGPDPRKIKKQIEQSYDIYNLPFLVKSLIGDRYSGLLRNIIYENYRGPYQVHQINKNAPSQKVEDTTLYQVVKLCQLPTVKAVVTYNYDTLLEDALRVETDGRDFVSIVDNHEIESNMPTLGRELVTLPIYHVHGFLPRRNDINYPVNCEVVLAMDEYLNSFRQQDSWNNTTQIFFLRNHPCLFIGTSLKDINMLRHLFSTRENKTPHSSIRLSRLLEKTPDPSNKTSPMTLDEIRENAVLQKLESHMLNHYNIRAIYQDSIPDFLMKLNEQLRNRSPC